MKTLNINKIQLKWFVNIQLSTLHNVKKCFNNRFKRMIAQYRLRCMNIKFVQM